MQPNETKPTPPADLSLKFMAWDIKQLSKTLVEVVTAIKDLTTAIKTNPPKPVAKSIPPDEVPF